MRSLLYALALGLLLLLSPAPATAGEDTVRIWRGTAATGEAAPRRVIPVPRTARRIVAVPLRKSWRRPYARIVAPGGPSSCRTVWVRRYGVRCRILECEPTISAAMRHPVQPWAYDQFESVAGFAQKSGLWQSHFAPSRTNRTIYWGY